MHHAKNSSLVLADNNIILRQEMEGHQESLNQVPVSKKP